MAGTPGTFRFPEIAATPANPPPGYALIYIKTDNVVYLLDSIGVETPLGSSSSITALTGDVSAVGPASAVATVNFVGGSSAALINAAELRANAATAANTPLTIVFRDASGNFSASMITANLTGNVTGNLTGNVTGNVNGVNPAAHASRHLPAGADALTTAAPLVNLDANTTNATGTANSLARSDHSHDISTGVVSGQAPNQSNAEGTSANLARADHVHNIPTSVPTGLDADSVNTQGGAGGFSQADHIHAIASGPVSTQVPDQANATGISANFARADHIHNIPATAPTTTLDPTTTNSEGTDPSFARGDHTHAIATSLVGDITTIQPDDSASAGTVDKYARGDHKHAIVAAPASTVTPDQANAEGSSTSFSRADHIHNIPATAPITTLDPTTSNAEGTASSFARGDHTHAVSTAPVGDITTIQPDDTASAGVANTFARGDHRHAISAAVVSTLTPDQANAEGASTSIARADHIHNIPSGTPVQVGTSNFAGAAANFALSDHVHNHGAQTSGTLHAAATTSVNGFMSAADKVKVDNELPGSLGAANQVLGVNAAGTLGEYKTITPTANQVGVVFTPGVVTLSTPQDIHSGATPTFAGENLTDRLELSEQSAPSTPAANKTRIYAEDSNGFTRLRNLDDTGYTSTLLRDTIFLCKNTTGSTISKGKVVYVNNSDSANGVVTIALAKADSSSTVPAFGLAIEDITNGSFGRVISTGILSNVDTSAFSDGNRVYLSATTAGGLTATKPSSPNIWQRVAVVIKAHATLGILEVRPLATHGEESGTNTGWTANVVALTDAANIATDASLGNTFTVTLGGNRNLSAPTNPTNGQKIVYRVTQDGTGNRGLTFDAIFNFGSLVPTFLPSPGANKTDYIGCIYNSSTVKWDVVAVSKGF